MHDKNIKRANSAYRKHRSLSFRTFRATIIGAILLGTVSLMIGIGLYAYALSGQYIGAAFNLSRTTSSVLSKVTNVNELADMVMDRFRRLPQAELKNAGSAAYREYFSDIAEREDYKLISSILGDMLESSDVYSLYLAMYDRESLSVVYIVDSEKDPDVKCYPGALDPVSEEEMERFLSWDGTGRLYNAARTEKFGWLATSGVPVKDGNGEIKAFVLADTSLKDVSVGMGRFFLQFALAMLVVINAIGFAMAAYMRKRIVKPINSIALAAEQYIVDRKMNREKTEHFSKLEISTGDEVENLYLIMADMEKELDKYESNLTKITAEKERIVTELTLARRIQANMLPSVFPAFPERSEFDIYATMTPAKEVGGDFYDFYLIDENHLGIVIADVSGKGIPAALFMMVSKILVKNYAMAGKSPSEVLTEVNERICSNNREEMFVTVWFGILDIPNGILKAANAGHEYPTVKKPDGSFEIFKDNHSFVLGGMSGIKYKEYEIKLEPGSKLFLYTDGVTEATNGKKELFGTERMIDALNEKKDDSIYDIIASVHGAIKGFVKDEPSFDDITMLCLSFAGKGGGNEKTVTLDATVENIGPLTDFVNAELEAHQCSVKAQMQIDVVIDEIFGNIAKYAYAPDVGQATVSVSVDDAKTATLIFADSGKPYDPLKAEDPDTTLSAEERKIGGLGIFLVKKTMDDVRYEYKNGKNILTIKKNI